MKQLEMFPPLPPTANEKLDAELAEMRLAQMQRDATRPNAIRRNRGRKRDVRGKTLSITRMSKRELELGRALFPEEEHADVRRPRTRAECKKGPRPCPFVSCRHHLYLDVSSQNGAIKVHFPDLEPDELAETCALDVADRGGETLERVGELTNLTRERVRQIEIVSLAKLEARREMVEMRDLCGLPETSPKRHLPVVAGRCGSDDLDEDQ